MKVLLTGGSSFTGYWFLRELVAAGHEVVATFTVNGPEDYDPLREARVRQNLDGCRAVWNCRFGDERFNTTIAEGNFDLVCHHGAYVRDYKSLDFDVLAAAEANTHNVRQVLETMVASDRPRLLLTGSVFEANEGQGSEPLGAFSPYGLSKGLSFDIFKYWCEHYAIDLAKFVIPNPFGPWEEKRFTAYLINNWLNGKVPSVNTPDYVRDNIHVDLLARAYVRFAEDFAAGSSRSRLNPSGYTETQGQFAQRLAAEMRDRLGVACDLELARQQNFDEPMERINYDSDYVEAIDWDEKLAWDAMADYYLEQQPG